MFRNPNSQALALRDPAMAALVGAIAKNGADFGDEMYGDSFGDDMYGDFGDDMAAEVAAEVAADFGDDVGAAVQNALAARPAANLARRGPQAGAWAAMARSRNKSMQRAGLLNPNKGSTVKVEAYELPMSEAIVIGTAQTFTALSTTPQTTFKPNAMVCNAPIPGYAFINDIKAANVSASVSNFITDAYNYNANATRSTIHLPMLQPQTTVSITGNYTGAIPPGVLGGTASFFTATLYGPSTMAGG